MTKRREEAALTEAVAIPAPPVVKTRQVQRFYLMLVELGMDEYIQNAIESRRKAVGGVRKATVEDQGVAVSPEEEIAAIAAEIESQIVQTLDMRRIIQTLGKEGRLAELVSIVHDCPMEEAEELSIEATFGTGGAFFDFAAQSQKPISALLGYARYAG